MPKEIVKVYIRWASVDKLRSFIKKKFGISQFEGVVGILNGGATPALVVANTLGIPVYWVQVRSYKGTKKVIKKPVVTILNDIPVIKEHGSYLIVDDIWDTGSTMKAVMEALKKYAYSCSGVTLVSKSLDCEFEDVIAPIFKPKDVWVVFPWEVDSNQEHLFIL